MKEKEEAKALLDIKKVIFKIEREGSKKETSGIHLYDKLIDGWKIVGYRIKK